MTVATELKLQSTEELLCQKLSGCELWGDIRLTKEEYDALAEMLASYLQGGTAKTEQLCTLYS